MKAVWKQDSTNTTKTVSAGFSWTVFFLGALVPLWRRHWLWFGIMLGIGIVALTITILSIVVISDTTVPELKPSYFILSILSIPIEVVMVYLCVIYNRSYAKHLIKKGYKVVEVIGGNHDALEGIWNTKVPKADKEKNPFVAP